MLSLVTLWPASLAAAALRVARDRPFRACGSLACARSPFRAKVNVPSAPAGTRGVARRGCSSPIERALIGAKELRTKWLFSSWESPNQLISRYAHLLLRSPSARW